MTRSSHTARGLGRTLLTLSVLAACADADPTQVVPDPASISLERTTVSFAVVEWEPDPSPAQVAVANGGEVSLSGLAAEVSYGAGLRTGWLTASLDASTAPAILTLGVQAGGLVPGTYQARTEVSGSAANSPQAVAVTLTVADGPEPPRIALSTGRIDLDIVEGDPDPSPWTVLVENEGEVPLDGLSLDLSYGGTGASGWLTAALDSATAPTMLHLSAATSGLPPGSHFARVEVASAVASNVSAPLNVFIDVAAAQPVLELSPLSRFTATTGSADPPPQHLSARNGGTGELHGISYSIRYAPGQPTGWLDASLDTSQVNAARILLSPVTGSLPPALYEATVTVESPDATNGPQSADVLFEVRPPGPVIAVDPQFVSFNAVLSGPAPAARTVDVRNIQAGTLSDLSVQVFRGQGWLTATLDRTTAPATLTLTVDPTGLAVDYYQADVEVSSPVAENGSVSVGVSLTVSDGLPDLTLGGAISPDSPVPAGELLSFGPLTRLNQGRSRSVASHLGFYLSTDDVIGGSDTLLDEYGISSLDAGEEQPVFKRSIEIPASTPPGDYYLIVVIDEHDRVLEEDETNNQLSAVFTVDPPIPVTHWVSAYGVPGYGGSVDGDPNGFVTEGETIVLTPVARPGYVFDSWGGDASGAQVPLEIVVDRSLNIEANFIVAPVTGS